MAVAARDRRSLPSPVRSAGRDGDHDRADGRESLRSLSGDDQGVADDQERHCRNAGAGDALDSDWAGDVDRLPQRDVEYRC